MEKNHTINPIRDMAYDFFIPGMIKTKMKSNKAFKQMLEVIGDGLADLRMKKGYSTIKEFVQKYDLPEVQYWRMEKGKSNLTLKSLVRILNIHDLSLQDFFCLIIDKHLI